jgi:two-component sensor histidine kinase
LLKANKLIPSANDSTKSYYYNTSGVVNLRLNNIDTALSCFFNVLRINKLEQKGSRYALINNIGLCYQKKRNLVLSDYYFKKCIDSCKLNNEVRLGAISSINLAINEFLKANHPKSIQISKEAIPILINKKAIPKLVEGYELLVKNYKYLNISDSVNKYLSLYHNTKDSIFNETVKQQLSTLEKTLELENKNLEIEKKTNEINASKKQAKLYQFIILIAVFSLILFLYLVTVIIKRNKLLKNQKAIIQDNLKIKDNLLSEIHHRVKNNLQLVSSLLELQLAGVKDENTIKTMNESKNRINSMIILHEKLYQNQDVTYINTSEYISNLIVNVNSSYSIGEKVEFILETDNIKLSLDTAVPLGLILNEVLTNCFKYAFKNISDPRIVIVLKIENELLLVCIHDNGIGISDINQVNNKSFGYKLIHSLCRQLDAELKISNNNGTLVELQIKDFRLYE